MLHTHMRAVYNNKTFALLTYVATRFYSRVTMVKSALRSKLGLVSCVMSDEWAEETTARSVDPVVKTKAKEVKKVISDTQNWLRASASVRFLSPLVSLTQMMGTDDGDALPFFYIMMVSIKLLWDTNTATSAWQFNDTTTGYCGVPLKQAIEANKLLYLKLLKHKHPLQGVAALLHTPASKGSKKNLDEQGKKKIRVAELRHDTQRATLIIITVAVRHPYNISPLTVLDENYRHVKLGERPCEGLLEDLEDDFTSFISTYVRDSETCAELEEVLVAYLARSADNQYFKKGAFRSIYLLLESSDSQLLP